MSCRSTLALLTVLCAAARGDASTADSGTCGWVQEVFLKPE